MKVIIAGSRDITSLEPIEQYLKFAKEFIEEVVCGEARGVDSLGREWAEKNNIPVKSFPADWVLYGKKAGPIRNKEMAEYADVAIVLHNGSRGSLDMIDQMKKLNKKVMSVRI